MFRKLAGSRRRIVALVAAAVLALGGIAAIVFGIASQQSAPEVNAAAAQSAPSAASGTPDQTPSDQGAAKPSSAAQGQVLPPAEPTGLSIPAIDVSSPLFTVGQNPDGTIHVPQPGPNYDKAAWYKGSPKPGELGPSVLLGHIDSAENGPSVFFRLAAMQSGQKVSVTRADGTVAVFTVDKIEKYDKEHFPTLEVYGNTNRAELRLITCGGVFNDAADNYQSNIVVYAHLTGSHPAG